MDRLDVPIPILRVEHEQLLEFRWGAEVIRFELFPDGDGCRFLLSHEIDDPAMGARNAAGWDWCLQNLVEILETRFVQLTNTVNTTTTTSQEAEDAGITLEITPTISSQSAVFLELGPHRVLQNDLAQLEVQELEDSSHCDAERTAQAQCQRTRRAGAQGTGERLDAGQLAPNMDVADPLADPVPLGSTRLVTRIAAVPVVADPVVTIREVVDIELDMERLPRADGAVAEGAVSERDRTDAVR